MASPFESPTWEREVLCGCKGCAVARKPLQDAIDRVRELHQPVEKHSGDFKGKREYCCEYYDPYPCGTIEALDGEK